MRLEGKVAIVTGGAGGIGRAVTRVFSREGAKVLFVDVDEDQGRALEQEIAEAGGEAKFLGVDISQADSATTIRDAAVSAFGRIDVLVNNAHASRQAPLLEQTQEMFDISFGTGFYPTVHLMQACYPQLKESQGSIINFGSSSGLEGMPTQTSYAAAKEAIRGVSRVAANEWAADQIRVNVLCPFAATEGVVAWQQAFPERAAATVARVPLQRIGDPETDIAPVAVFLASDDSKYMTGQTLMADGGSLKLR